MSNDSDDNDLSGFKDFIEKERISVPKKESTTTNKSSFELYTFLEHESHRLEKVINLFKQKVPQLKKFDQSMRLHQNIDAKIRSQESLLISKINENKQGFLTFLDKLSKDFHS